MPLPQVNDRLKEIPAQALRTVFATIGQVLLVADRLRAKAAGQLSGGGAATATRPADQAPAPAPPPPAKPARPARPDAGNSRWRSLDKTGNVRVLDGGEEQDDEEVPSVSKAVPEPAPAPVPPAEYTPTEVVPAVSVPAEPAPAVPAPAEAEPAMQQEAQPAMQQEAEPAPAGVTAGEPLPAKPAMQQEAQPAQPAAAASQALPVPNYDQLSVASLRARLRVLDAGQVQTLLDYENAHESRPAVITMFERRLTKLSEGN
jgi:outer membrane biosynthesis protein TonB